MSDPKRPRVERSTDPSVWMHWYNELSSDGESSVDDEDEDELEEDVIQHSDHNTDSEEEIEDNVLGQNTNESSSADFYLGKDKNTKWRRLRPNIQVRTRAHNIVKLLPGPKGTARIAKSEIECFITYTWTKISFALLSFAQICI
nr:unnamed protein product [Callosobruchus analis]